MMQTPTQTLITIIMVALATMATRFLPFLLLRGDRAKHPILLYLGQVLPYAAIGFLVVYCLKGVNLGTAPFGLPELIAIAAIVSLHLWRRNTLLSIGVGTALYMALVQLIFV